MRRLQTMVAEKKGGIVQAVPAKRAITITDLHTQTAGTSYGTGTDVAKRS